ncbi:MAG: hypothetical protein IKH92_08760 [Clostridiales bacterium]|nr:hypothetical protein [Clostridiales bacterium]
MKRTNLNKTAIFMCCAALMVSMAGCASKKDSETSKEETTTEITTVADTSEKETQVESSEETAKETTAESSENETVIALSEKDPEQTVKPSVDEPDTKPETEKEPSKEENNGGEQTQAPSSEQDPESLYAECEKYIEESIAFYNNLYGEDMKLIVFDSQIEKTDEGYSFIIRSRAGKDANVYVAEVKVNVETGVMTGENGMTWKLGDYTA